MGVKIVRDFFKMVWLLASIFLQDFNTKLGTLNRKLGTFSWPGTLLILKMRRVQDYT